jgi:hypothetical protein
MSKAQRLAFPAALAQGKGCLSVDHEGEATLKLAIPASSAQDVMALYSKMQDRSFYVVIDLTKEPA